MVVMIEWVRTSRIPKNMPKRLTEITWGGKTWMMPNNNPESTMARAAVDEFLNPVRIIPRNNISSATAGMMPTPRLHESLQYVKHDKKDQTGQ